MARGHEMNRITNMRGVAETIHAIQALETRLQSCGLVSHHMSETLIVQRVLLC